MWSRRQGRGNRRSNWSPRGGGNRGRGNFQSGRRGRGFHDNNFKRSDGKPFQRDNYSKKENIEKLHEVDVGITGYISNLKGFSGILKSRYSDFHVNEIDCDGQEAKLTNLKIPRDPTPPREEEDDDLVVNRYRIEQLPIETWDRIHKMIQNKDQNEVIEIDVTSMTKQDRTKIHEAVKTVFGRKIVGSTVNKDDKKFVIIKLYNKNEKIDLREKWPKTREGEYVFFLVYKEYTDTIEANIQIAEALQMRPSFFNYAGVKDRRAKTTQWFCAKKIEPSRISERCRYLKNIKIGNFCYKQHVLKLGQLKGNRFRIALRNVTAENEIIEKALQSLKDTGFINFYGLQRFGNCKEIPTHEIGLQLLRGNFRGAVESILKPRKYEQDRDIAAAKQIYKNSGDVNKALEALGKKKNRSLEGKLLGGLCKHSPNDFVNSLENVPRNMRLLYIHAYQSLVWNKIVSRRIKEFGMKPIVGDLVVEGEIEEILPFLEANDEISLDNIDNINTMEKAIQEKGTIAPKVNIKVLTEKDLDSYSIYDIVLPLPGYDITYPNNVVKDWYEAILIEDGLSLEMPKQKVKTYTLSGAYRKVIERVDNFSWKIMRYNELTSTLIRSDYEELLSKPEPEDIPEAKYKALIIDFCLKPSCYATMALREVMKIDTSVETHMNLDKIVTDNHISVGTQTIAQSSEEIIEIKEEIKTEPENGEFDDKNQINNDETIVESKNPTNDSETVVKHETNDSETVVKHETNDNEIIAQTENQTKDRKTIVKTEYETNDSKTVVKQEHETNDSDIIAQTENQTKDSKTNVKIENQTNCSETIVKSEKQTSDKRKLANENDPERKKIKIE